MYTIILLLSLVPHTEPIEYCGNLQVNHIYNVSTQFGQPQVTEQPYWIGWRCNPEYPVVDWWRSYNNERVWINDGKYYLLLYDNKYSRYVLIIADKYDHVWTPYDIEAEQRQELEKDFGLKHKEYRRGLLFTKPQ